MQACLCVSTVACSAQIAEGLQVSRAGAPSLQQREGVGSSAQPAAMIASAPCAVSAASTRDAARQRLPTIVPRCGALPVRPAAAPARDVSDQ